MPEDSKAPGGRRKGTRVGVLGATPAHTVPLPVGDDVAPAHSGYILAGDSIDTESDSDVNAATAETGTVTTASVDVGDAANAAAGGPP